MAQECKSAIQRVKDDYFSEIKPEKGVETISIEALHMKGFIDGLTAALEIEPEFEEEANAESKSS